MLLSEKGIQICSIQITQEGAVASQYGQRLHSHFTNTRDSHWLWQSFCSLTDYKPCSPPVSLSDPSLPDQLANFFAHLEDSNFKQAQEAPPEPSDQIPQLSTAGIKTALASINPQKPTTSQGGGVLENCAERLKEVVTNIFNLSLRQAGVLE